MRYSAPVLALAAAAAAAPAFELKERATGPSDADILQYALTLEHLEATFYAQALQKFTSKDFEAVPTKAGFFANLGEIAADEKAHVDFLTGALSAAGAKPVAACSYNFGYSDVNGFLATANILEGVGVSAYLGAAKFITDPTYLTYAGAVLTVESRHSAYLRNNQPIPQSPFPAPFDIPLSLNQVYTLAAGFITSCPKSNVALPVKAFPALALGNYPTPVRQGQTIPITAKQAVAPQGAWFITALGPVAAQFSGSGTSFNVLVPEKAAAGQSYLVFTKDKNAPTDDNTVAGPAIVPVQSKYTYGISVKA